MWLYWSLLFAIFQLIIIVLLVFSWPFDPYQKVPNYALSMLAWLAIKPVPTWHFKIEGAGMAKVDGPTIVVANHQSFLDIPLLYLLPWNMKWVTKRGMRRIPVLGWMITMTGHIPVDRKSFRSFREIGRLRGPVRAGIPGMIFPEGTRSKDGHIQSLKRGAFKIAKKYDFRILPVVVNGGFYAMPPGSWKFRFHNEFTVSVLNPVSASDFKDENKLRDHVYELMRDEFDDIQPD